MIQTLISSHFLSVFSCNSFARSQGENVTEAEAAALLAHARLRDFVPAPDAVLTRSQFFAYLASPAINSWLSPRHAALSQDMTRPLAHYYVSSSHNTYLEGDQLKSNSSVNTYINAFAQGCRCVELDCWDGADGEPIIYHGHTLTSKILFKDVVAAVKEHGFSVSPYPIILSLENHCSPEYQKAMAVHLQTILGPMLVTAQELAGLGEMPSPESLKGRVLCKDKSKRSKPSSAADERDDDDDALPAEPPSPSAAAVPALSRLVTLASDSDLSALVTLNSVSFQGLPKSSGDLAQFPPLDMVSFSEGQIGKLIKKGDTAVAQMHTRVFSRIYPSGIRIDSSNYDPVPAWNAGAQIVALNLQTNDEHTVLNRGKFATNGRSGYVLKPACLLPAASAVAADALSSIVNANDAKAFIKNGVRALRVRIVSARNLPKPDQGEKGDVVDPYVKCCVRGAPCDESSWKSPRVDNNGFHPVWNSPTGPAQVFEVRAWELAHLVLMVFDHDTFSSDELLCANAIELSSLRRGHRFVPLSNAQGQHIPGCGVFCHFDF